MKIGPLYRVGTFGLPKYLGRKKALLIGINYDSQESPSDTDFVQLAGPRADALEFRKLLLEKYEYEEDDIVLLTDDAAHSAVLPTRHNIISEIEKLVRGARAGDRFVFLYSGHSGQIACLEHSEIDGLDEVILPMDHAGLDRKDKLIVDNDLKKLLVDPLPPGAYLTAIFDSCHSGTLLDLEHYDCNQVYHPWISKGERKMRTRWLNNVRKDATDEPAVRILQRRASTGPGHSSLRKEVTLSELTDLEASIAPPPGKPKFGSLKIRTQQSAPVGRKRSSTSSSTSAASALEAVRPRLALNLRRMSTEMIDSALEFFPRCMSPVSSVRECDGNCVESPTEKPHVISLAACADTQVDWEDKTGMSMTQMLIQKLRENPHPSLGELMTFISYRRYDVSRHVHAFGNKLRKKGKRLQKARAAAGGAPAGDDDTIVEVPVEVVNFQDPQLGSQEKLNMDAPFML
ncbi:hypothetical protein IEO21_03789 [Rhodonia placenta]|uniref:Uncharacterized protein n=1 Tax=Rhodonia placenta TaxID=104341 RepID=A0A8H7P535_9APHY|nr:hypothetical protein IEO21_03789 [Postia placenta]